MLSESSTSVQGDEHFRAGPETLAAASPMIVAGLVSKYAKQVLTRSEPAGPGSIPLAWKVTGQLDRLQALKGESPAGTLPFSRTERSFTEMVDPSRLYWEREYGDLVPDGSVVLFAAEETDAPRAIVPSGAGEDDLIVLVQKIVRIQALADPETRAQAWLSSLQMAPTDRVRKAALRSLIHGSIEWEVLSSVLVPMLSNAQLSAGMRAFTFGIAAFSIGAGRWGSHGPEVLETLCHAFAAEQAPDLSLREILFLKQLLARSDKRTAEGRALQDRIFECLQRRSAAGPLDPASDYQYQEIERAHPGRLP